jgi:hypothetical protein
MDGINQISSKLEDAFFLKEDQKLIEKRKHLRQMEETKQRLAEVSGIKDEALLKKLVELKIHAETVAAFALVPLIEVAWADGDVDEDEKSAILKSVRKGGVEYELIERWLSHKPDPSLLAAWVHYIQGLSAQCTPAEFRELKNELLGHARSVAEATGGFLGLGNKISDEEQAVLKKLESAFQGAKK